MGYDTPRNLGNRETGGGLTLPIWINYMQKALKDIPVDEREVPPGLIQSNGDYYYAENPPGMGVSSLGINDQPGLGQDSEKYDSILKKIEVKEQQDLDKSVSISRFGFVNAILRRFCE